jgi:hypothetical protein
VLAQGALPPTGAVLGSGDDGGKQVMFAKILARDLVIVALTALIWHLGAAASATPGVPGDFAGVLAGVTVGLCAYLLHEWGHLAGALAAGSSVRPPRSLASGFLFSFDSRRNTRRQFLALSFGGWATTALAVWLVYAKLPDLFAARVARGVVLANVLLVIAIELPLVAWSLWTGRVPPVENQRAAAPVAAG